MSGSDASYAKRDGSGRPRIAVTMGDPNGIGPEIVLKSVATDVVEDSIRPVIIGAVSTLNEVRAHMELDAPHRLDVIDISDGDAGPVPEYGRIDGRAGRLAMRAVEAAVDLCLSGEVDAMVTAPISKEAVRLGGYDIPGHTEFIADRVAAATGAGVLPHTMLMVSGTLRVGLVTAHVPLRSAADGVTEDLILEKLRVMNASLRMDFGVPVPRIGVLGLNPHSGDGGVLGVEERDIIAPAIGKARSDGFDVDGPFAADGFFGRRADADFDAVLAMYHDQGLVPFKTLSFGRGTNFTAGLPIVRTSPDHGTAFDIAGRGVASADSLVEAILVAARIRASRGMTDSAR